MNHRRMLVLLATFMTVEVIALIIGKYIHEGLISWLFSASCLFGAIPIAYYGWRLRDVRVLTVKDIGKTFKYRGKKDITVTLPSSGGNIPIGSVIVVKQLGDGKVSIQT
ncbi:hypothetical protein UFOVP276_231 [uncultured Caudovirales phage]|uniref:Uncharacterized protein n=1 Tax=uncultured Caudovirales phage TaxID=2100421 RepID=A0A6J5LLV0_9CAUD|nr:hypothetical protein UFOVP127_125 [uncultured Caudovirales phage]CAB4135275.1 hypothetical protein UFOVP276_231 [uncultured Caudovirales phage]